MKPSSTQQLLEPDQVSDIGQFSDPPWRTIILPKLLAATTAVRSTTLALTGLAKNAVINTFDVRLTAAPADQTPLGVAQIRTNVINNNLVSIVVDFGTLVTVSGIQLSDNGKNAIGVYKVHAWTGTAFAYEFHTTPFTDSYTGNASDADPSQLAPVAPSTAINTVFASEVRTEKLQIEIITTVADKDTVAGYLMVHLPDAPSGLELTTDTGLRLFAQVPTVVPLGTDTLTDQDWNDKYQRIVHLAPQLATLAGNAVSHDPLPVTLTLSSRVPGALEIEELPRDVEWLERMPLGPDGSRDLVFTEEGETSFSMTLDAAYKTVTDAKLTALGKPGPARVQPPLGPTPIPDLDLVLTPELTMACRIPVAGLATLTGVRLALAAGTGGAEVKIAVLQDVNGEPGPAIDGAVSKPVTLPEGAAAVDAPWMTYALPKAIDLTKTPSPWIAILVARGRLAWSMGQYDSMADALPVRRGAPSGPWGLLPSMFQQPTGFLAQDGKPLDLTQLGARVRAIGTAPTNTPIAPYRFAITTDSTPIDATSGAPLTPTPKGVAFEWTPATPLPVSSSLTVQVVSLVADTLTLRDLDVTLTR